MNIKVKQLQGGECTVEVTPTTKISDIKKLVAIKLKIPEKKQKLLLLGRALTDEQTVEFYPGIKNGTKLHLVVVKKPDGLAEFATKKFKESGMSDAEARAKANLLCQVLDEKVQKLSWDDLERLALDCLMEEHGRLPPAPEPEHDVEFEDALGL